MENRYIAQVPGLASKEETVKSEVDPSGSRFVNPCVRHAIQITIGQAIPHGPCDYLMFSGDTTATIQHAEDAVGEEVALPLVGKVWHESSAAKITAATNAVTAWAGWIRRPAGA